MGAIPGYKASVYITTTPSVAVTNMALTNAGDNKTFSTGTAARRYWDPAQAITIQTSPDGVSGWTTVNSGFSIQYVGGIVVFTAAVSGATPSVRASVSYMPYSAIADAKSVEINTAIDVLDSTTFASGGWKTKIASLADASIKLTKWWVDNFYLTNLGVRMVVVAYSGANPNQRYEAFAFLKQDAIKVAQNALIEESLDFEVDGPVYAILS